MKVKIIRGYFSNGPKLYRAGEVLDLPDDVAAGVIGRAGGDIVIAESSPTPTPKTKSKATKKSAKKKAPVEESEEDMSLPDVDAAAAISK